MTTRQDALYTNSTLALDPSTGQVRWYFQHAPGETLDLDIVYKRVLVDADGEKWVFTIGKDGILWKMSRRLCRPVNWPSPSARNCAQRLITRRRWPR